MPRRVLCKFFVHGACLKGDHCEFLHDWNAPANNMCTFYQKGICSYGSCCRYNHIKVSRPHFCNGSSSANFLQSASSDHVTITHPSKLTTTSEPLSPQEEAETETHNPDKLIYSFAAASICPRGEKCPHLHGDICSSCGNYCLHPYRPLEREDHIALYRKKENHLDALKYSQDTECSVCLELVLSKPTAFKRKFGLLSECDHPFCITCIRNWRSSSPSFGMDVNSTLRACPICRKLSFFVIPSLIWYSTQEEKLEIVNSYKAKLRSIDCKHFDFGNGTYPFGSSCFYKHAYRDGCLEEVVFRHLGAEDGDTVIAKDMRLSDFLSSMSIM